MLYNTFLVCMMITSFFGILHMIDNQNLEYIIFPIALFVTAIFKFFDANDRKYLEGLGIDPDEYNAFFPEYYDDYSHNRKRNSIYAPSGNNNTNTNENTSSLDTKRGSSPSYKGGFGGYERYMPKRYQDPSYKGMAAKCKRNFKITVINTEEKNESTERILSTVDRIS